MTTINELEQAIAENEKERKLIRAAKGNDYSGTQDTLRNLRKRGILGIMMRMEDKMERLGQFYFPEPGHKLQVTNETILDTWQDIANYAEIAVAEFVSRVAVISTENLLSPEHECRLRCPDSEENEFTALEPKDDTVLCESEPTQERATAVSTITPNVPYDQVEHHDYVARKQANEIEADKPPQAPNHYEKP